jgi:hypothetical protein
LVLMEHPDFRARLEQQAATIIGRARAEAAEIVRAAEARAEEIEAEAKRRADAVMGDVEGLRDQAHLELVKAQERALLLRSDAQRNADGIVERATLRARAEADELLREAQQSLARAIDEKSEAQARIAAAEEAERAAAEAERRAADAVEIVAMAAAEAVVEATAEAGVPMARDDAAAAIDLTMPSSRSPRDRFLVTMQGETFDDLLAGAIRAAVRQAFNPLGVRAGRYVEPRILEPRR